MGERLVRNEEVAGSSPVPSTISFKHLRILLDSESPTMTSFVS